MAKKCKKTCEKCPTIPCPGDTIPNGNGNCVCPGSTIDYGNGNCSCAGDTEIDGVGDCSCPGDTVNDGLGACSCPENFMNDGQGNCFQTNGKFLILFYIQQKSIHLVLSNCKCLVLGQIQMNQILQLVLSNSAFATYSALSIYKWLKEFF